MPGFLLQLGASVQCAHAGQALPAMANPRVTINGQPVITQTAIFNIAGCPFSTAAGPMPCITAQYYTAATRVFADGQPVLLIDSQATCVPNGTPLLVTASQSRVTGI